MSSSNPVAHIPNNAAQWWWKDPGLRSLALGISLGFSTSVSMGFDGSVMGGLQAHPLFMKAIDSPSANKLGAIVSAQSLGGLPGLLPASFVADSFGRRVSMAVGFFFLVVGALVQAFTTGGWNMFAGRFILGFGSSFATVSGGPYTIEIAHPRNRAQTGALINTCFYIGSIIASWITFGTVYMKNTSWGWRMCLLFQVIIPIYALVIVWFCPESPRWLVSKGRVEDAHSMLAKYHANGDKSDKLVIHELQEIQEALEREEGASGTSFSAFFQTKGNRWRLAIILMIGFTSQWIGNGVISYYLVPILTSVGITEPAQQTGYNAGLQIFNWLAAVGGALVCERFGRRKMWLTSAIGMFFSYVVITGCSAGYASGKADGAGKAVMAFLFVFFGFYDIAYTGLAMAYPLEILPFDLRSKGMALFMSCMYLSLTFNTFVNPIALNAIAWKYYFVFIAVQLFSVAFIYLWFPETKGLLLEEVAPIFDGPDAALKQGGALRESPELKQHSSQEEVAYDKSGDV